MVTTATSPAACLKHGLPLLLFGCPRAVEGEVKAEETVVAEGAEGAAPAEGAAAEAPAPEVEEKEMTLDEYEKQLAEKKAELNKVAAEAKQVSMDDFKGMKAHVRKAEEEAVPGLELSKKKEAKAAKEPKEATEAKAPKKQTLDIAFKIADSSESAAPRGGRGGRGPRGDRPASGRGGRGGDRAPRGDGERRGLKGGLAVASCFVFVLLCLHSLTGLCGPAQQSSLGPLLLLNPTNSTLCVLC